MGTLCEIPTVKFLQTPNPSTQAGDEPEVRWLPIEKLRIERSYQREILKSGLSNIRHIIEEFRWTRFAPLVVSRRGDIFAVVDGQHRAAAARFLGISKLPCQIISCSIEEEARAFAAINGNVTKLSPLQVFHARLVAGDRKAKLLQSVVEAAGCRVPRNVQICDRPGLTLAIGTLQSCMAKYGDEVLGLALRMVVETGGGNPGLLRSGIIAGLCDVLAESSLYRRHHIKLKAAIERAGVEKLHQKAVRIQSVDGGPLRGHFADQVRKALSSEFALAEA